VITAVIVTHNPGPPLIENLRRLEAQLDSIIIVDNASDQNVCNVLDGLKTSSKVTLIRNLENVGLASALNQGIEFLHDHTDAWVFTFDQDSVVPAGYVSSMIASFGFAESIFGKVGVVAPIYRNRRTKSIIRFSKTTDEYPAKIITTLTSGSLFRVDEFAITGLFAANYFIDYIDYEYCLRLNQLGYAVVEIPTIILEHELGNSKIVRFLWHDRLVTQHSPSRRYFKTRNRIITYRRYFYQFPQWVIADLYGFFREFVAIVLLEDDKIDKIKYIMRGLSHGISGVTPNNVNTERSKYDN
jgi:rhamnosyltransferase